MSVNQKIVEACRRAYTGFEKNDRSALVPFLADDFVFEFPTSLPYGGTFRGLGAFKEFWRNLYENFFDSLTYDAHVVLDAGTHVVVPVATRGIAKNGRTMDNEHCILFRVDGGRIVHGRIYADTAKGRDVIGIARTDGPA